MRLLKKQGMLPKRMIPDKLRSYGAARRQFIPALSIVPTKVGTIEPRIRIRRFENRKECARAFVQSEVYSISFRCSVPSAISSSQIAQNLDGLQTVTHPLVEVVLDRFEATGNAYVGKGNVLVLGATVPVSVPFSMRRDGTGRAIVAGTAELDRLALGLGQKNDGKGEWLDQVIRVTFKLEATPIGPSS